MNQMDWDGLRLLLAVAATGSLRGAAEGLAISQPTLGRRLRALEHQLGQPLLLRHARGVTLTDEGREVVEAARGLEASILEVQRGLTGRSAEVRGRVRISCTGPVAAELLPACLTRLRDAHPALAVDVTVDAHASDLDRREADLAVRMFPPRSSDLIARRVGSTHTSLYASPRYLARHGRPEALADLLQHRVIGPDRDPLFVQQAARLGFTPEQMTFRTDDFATVLAWVRADVAIGALLAAVAHDLVELFPLVEHPVWLVTHPDLRRSAAVTAVWDELAAALPLRLAQSTSPTDRAMEARSPPSASS